MVVRKGLRIIKKMAKRPQKTKEQIVQETVQAQEIQEQKALCEKLIMPIFTKHNLTVYQSGQILEVMKQVCMGKMNAMWSDKPMSELSLKEELTSDAGVKDRDIYGDILDAVDNEPIAKIMKLWDVLGRLIDMYGNRQVMQIRFNELPIEEMMK